MATVTPELARKGLNKLETVDWLNALRYRGNSRYVMDKAALEGKTAEETIRLVRDDIKDKWALSTMVNSVVVGGLFAATVGTGGLVAAFTGPAAFYRGGDMALNSASVKKRDQKRAEQIVRKHYKKRFVGGLTPTSNSIAPRRHHPNDIDEI